MQTALLELLLLAIAGGVLGTWVVLRRLAFFTHAVGAATFPGLVAASAAGISPQLGAAALAVGYAGGVERVGRRRGSAPDAATALLLVGALALGVVLASDLLEGGAVADRLLFGSLLGLDNADLWLAAAAAALALACAFACGPTWTAIAFDPDGAPAFAPRARRLDALLFVVLALAVVASLAAVGALLVSALFVLPAATALLWARRIPGLVLAAVALAIAEAVLALYLSYWLDAPPGPTAAVVASTAYAAAVVVRAAIAPRREEPA